jgi:hypothetical protein
MGDLGEGAQDLDQPFAFGVRWCEYCGQQTPDWMALCLYCGAPAPGLEEILPGLVPQELPVKREDDSEEGEN